MSESKRRLILLDGHAQVYKAFHALGPLSNSRGEPTGALYGFLQSFHRIRRDYSPEHIAVVFDPPGASFRSEQYAEYKANRPPQPEELSVQIAHLKNLLAAMKVPVFEVPGFEADDVLATLAAWAIANQGEAIVASVDKDLMQIVRPGVRILREHLGNFDVLDEAGVFERMGVRPDQVAAFLGLLGDTSDNIPGVPGIGKKRAAELLAEHGTLEAVLEAAKGREKPKFWASLAENAAAARLSLQLATIRTDAPVEASWERLRWEYQDSPELRSLLIRFEFRTLLADLGPGPEPTPRATEYSTVRTSAQLAEIVAAIRAAGRASIDTETTGLDAILDELIGISLSWKKDQGVYIPVARASQPECLPLDAVRAALDPLLCDPGIEWIAHNWRFDLKVLNRAGFAAERIAFDTMVASFLLNPDRDSNGLKQLGVAILGIQMKEYKDVVGESGDLVAMADATTDVERFSDYACADADVTRQLADHFSPQLDEMELRPLFAGLEMPLIPVLSRMELEGVRLDKSWFSQLSREIAERLDTLRTEVTAIAGRPFNLNSPKQLAEILFDELKLPPGKKTASGYSTDVTVLEGLASLHPLPAKLLEYRQLEKLRGTYIEALPAMVNPRTGRVHTSFNQTVAATGRLSSHDPNLQNIPVRTEEGRKIRRGFVARDAGWKLLSVDYSQIELRILAHMSGDEALRDAFRDGRDIHALTASKVWHVPLEEVTKDMRAGAKAINFGIIYGMSAFRLGRDLDIGQKKAEEFIADYFKAYSGVRRFIDETLADCRRTGFVRTLMGRRRLIPDIRANNFNLRAAAERIAVNTPIQGTSADMIKVAMIRIDERIRRENRRARMILQVHDELIFDVPEDEIDALLAWIPEEMRNALPLSVPIQADANVGDTWADL